jgi:nitric oxide reductase NorE protein
MTQTEPAAKRVDGKLPGDSNMWVMVLGDMVIFAGYFVIFMIYRAMNRQEFLLAQQHLNIAIGVTNTVVLLTSSWLVARAVQTARAAQFEDSTRLVWGGAIGGVTFIVLKSYEWASKILAGQTNSEMFYSFYYVITGVHMVHVLIGLIVLGVVVRELRNPAKRRPWMAEAGATYWHMVDLLWVIIFALFYVMR